jgi:hypothetical protein
VLHENAASRPSPDVALSVYMAWPFGVSAEEPPSIVHPAAAAGEQSPAITAATVAARSFTPAP